MAYLNSMWFLYSMWVTVFLSQLLFFSLMINIRLYVGCGNMIDAVSDTNEMPHDVGLHQLSMCQVSASVCKGHTLSTFYSASHESSVMNHVDTDHSNITV